MRINVRGVTEAVFCRESLFCKSASNTINLNLLKPVVNQLLPDPNS